MKAPQARHLDRHAPAGPSWIWLIAVLTFTSAPAFPSAESPPIDPFEIVDQALSLRQGMFGSADRDYLAQQISKAHDEGPTGALRIAELMKQIGDPRAEAYYNDAILLANQEAAYELFLADYLRNFRGPLRPLFGEAEEHYFLALEKLRSQPSPTPWSEEVRKRVLRGLVALYQEDGIPVAWRNDTAPRAPYAFLSSTARAAKSTSDLDDVHDVRDLTAEALFAASVLRLNRPLTSDELRGLIRRKEPTLRYERLRFRFEGAALDLFYESRAIRDGQVTSFLRLNDFNRVRVNDLGVEISVAFEADTNLDGYFRQAILRADRKGLIESRPDALEHVVQGETELAFSWFSEAGKKTLSLIYVPQDIKPQIANPPRRDRRIWASRFDYQLLRPVRWLPNPSRAHFATRGLRFFAGFADDRERFDRVRVIKNDLFVGASLNGLGPLDLTLQPTIFHQQVSGDKTQTSEHLRLEGTLVLRLLDEEAHPAISRGFLGLHPAFVHLVVPFKRDSALEGLEAFENDRVGIGADVKFYVLHSGEPTPAKTGRFGATSVLLSCRYSRERFLRLDKKVNLMEFSFSLGY